MSDSPGSLFERPVVRTGLLLAMLAYVPALTAAPGRMPADSKLYLYLNPGRLMADAASTFDARQFAGWVPHQQISYLWPAGPWFWVFDSLGVPDWVAHRLWIGSLMVAAGLGVRWCARLLGLAPFAAAAAAVVYQVSPYVLPYVSRTSVMLLPWAGLGWIVAFTIRATRRQTWGDPAAIALVVFTVGSVNATALLMIVPAPALWLVHAAWQRTIPWRGTVAVAIRVSLLSLGVSVWWIVMLSIQGRFGADVLPYSESLADVSLTATSSEVWRGLGYWLFYIRDPYAAATTESLRYLSSTPSIFVSYLLTIVCLAGLVFVRWSHRRFAALLVAVGALLAVGVHPISDKSPLMRILAGDDDSGLALALRSSTRALPVMVLGLALAAGSLVSSFDGVRLPRRRWRIDFLSAGVVGVLAIVNLPSLWNGAFVDPALTRDEAPPEAWLDAAAALDEGRVAGRVLQLPGAEFGAYRWGYTVDQPLPSLTEKPLVTRDLLPLGSPAAMDLLFALDDRIQDGALESAAIAPTARLLGVDTIWMTNDLAFERFQSARPEVVADVVANAPGVSGPEQFGDLFLNRPDVAMTDERALGDTRVGEPIVPVELYAIEQPGSVVRAVDTSVIVSGSGDGLIDLAAAGLLDGKQLVQYSASLSGESLDSAIEQASAVLVTDSNRDRARHWRSSQDTTGYTEPGGEQQDVLRPVSSDRRLPVFEIDHGANQTTATQRGPVKATASSYGEPFAYLPEHRPYSAIDGDPSTAWTVAEHANPIGEMLRLEFASPISALSLRQPPTPGDVRRISQVSITVFDSAGIAVGGSIVAEITDQSLTEAGQPVGLSIGPGGSAEITITGVATPVPGNPGALAGVGFAEIVTDLGPTLEVVRPPHDALTAIDSDSALAISFSRLRTDPMDRWRDDPERRFVREFDLSAWRTLTVDTTVRVDLRASDAELARLFGWSAVASTRLTGSPRHAGISALDGDPNTSWITAFGGAMGATLHVAGPANPIDSISIRQPITGFSRITQVIVRTNGDERVVDLTPDAGGTSSATIDPPLAIGDVELEVTAIESLTTVDRRFGDVFELPASIIEFDFPGRPEIAPVGVSEANVGCTRLLSIDDVPINVSLSVAGSDWIDGAALDASVCEPNMTMAAGTHLIVSESSELPVTVDRVVLRDGVPLPFGSSSNRSVATVIKTGSSSRSIEITGCNTGCWLVLGEGYNEAWEASRSDRSLGTPVMVDGGFNGWWIEPTDSPILINVTWTQQRNLDVALVGSAAAALIALGLILRDRLRSLTLVGDTRVQSPEIVTNRFDSVTRRRAAITCVLWTVLAGLLIGPLWAIWGAIAGIAVVAVRRSRVPELVAIGSLCAIGATVVLIEFRESTFPNGAWPLRFEWLHGVGVFAVVALIVGALTADDSAPSEPVSDG